MPLTMKPKRAKARKRIVRVKVAKSARKSSAPPAATGSKSLKAVQREMDQWFETHIEQVYEAARANTRTLFGREKI